MLCSKVSKLILLNYFFVVFILLVKSGKALFQQSYKVDNIISKVILSKRLVQTIMGNIFIIIGGFFMKLTDQLYESAKDIWDSYYEHPFVKGIGTGFLDIDKFRFYMIQDYLYLLDYAKVFALGVVKAQDEEMMKGFANSVNSILNGEMSIHKSYMKRLGITEEEVRASKPSIDNTSYTNYMLWVSNNYGLLELAVAILSCSWSYKLIAEELSKIPGSTEHEFYGEWVKGYISKEYGEANQWILDIVNNLGKDINEKKLEQLKEIFINCSRYEYMFWDMSFNKEM